MNRSTDAILAQDDEALLRECRVSFFKSGGPGGQKRNKTSSAATIIHTPTGIEAQSSDFRTQAENRVRALHRLRFKIAAAMRTTIEKPFYQPPEWAAAFKGAGQVRVNVKNIAFARVAAHLLDLLAAADGKVSPAAALLGVSSSSFARLLKQEHGIWDAACRIRRHAGPPASASRI
ncbi:MAG TPA: peptide chain release factor-like protein [Tepidisphaeraceae bacterium]|nr:peptide chain release factor-like protein [Tepidisphaeraceae bacterium]